MWEAASHLKIQQLPVKHQIKLSLSVMCGLILGTVDHLKSAVQITEMFMTVLLE